MNPDTGQVIVVMGVAGSGKTTIGRELAAALGVHFLEGDDYHPRPNSEKMSRGEPLTDADRVPWLRAMRGAVEQVLGRRARAVLACSVLKRAYRDVIRIDPARMPLVYLKGGPQLIASRLRSRVGHFAGEALLASQLATLEDPDEALVVDVARSPDDTIRTILGELSSRSVSSV